MKWKALAVLAVVLVSLSACTPQREDNSSAGQATPAGSAALTEDVSATSARMAALPAVDVYKSPTCGCCEGWIEHLEENGYAVSSHDVNELSTLKARYQVPGQLQSCHTALVDGYVVEGHVPAEALGRLLNERPAVVGLAVPGMPTGSPGMEVDGYPNQPFVAMTFDSAGNAEAFMAFGQ